MNIELLRERRAKLLSLGRDIREDISQLTDADSFIELSSYSFSKNEYYDENGEGEAVITGLATIESYPFYIIAQNFHINKGAINSASTEKILKCLNLAKKSQTPVIYLLSSLGVALGEGISVLEGFSAVIKKATELSGKVPQFTIINGDVYGLAATLTAVSDFNFFLDKSTLAIGSPFVISAKSGKNVDKGQVGAFDNLKNSGLFNIKTDSIKSAKSNILKIIELLPKYAQTITEYKNLNEFFPQLNAEISSDSIINSVFDKGSYLEASGFGGVKCIIGRIGGIASAAVVFDSGDGVNMNEKNCSLIKDFLSFAANYNLPVINFVNTLGIELNMQTNNSRILKNVSEVISGYLKLNNAKISLIYGKAIGLGYSVFAAKSLGYDYVAAFPSANISLFDTAQGIEIELSGVNGSKDKLMEKYALEYSDPINAAKGGYIDDIIEPSNIKQHLIAALQVLVR